jgi:hypothetical protein
MNLFESISLNHKAEVQRHIASGADLNAPNAKGVKPIVEAFNAAFIWRDMGVLQMLRKAKANSRPLIDLVTRKILASPQILLNEHDRTAEAINQVFQFKDKFSHLTAEEKARVKSFVEAANKLSENLRSLRDRAPSLCKAMSQDGEGTVEEAVGFLIDAEKFGQEVMRLGMESVIIEKMFE